MASETNNAEALETAGQDADSLGSDSPEGVMKCRQIGTEHELEEPSLLEIETKIEPPEGMAESSETGSDAGEADGAAPSEVAEAGGEGDSGTPESGETGTDGDSGSGMTPSESEAGSDDGQGSGIAPSDSAEAGGEGDSDTGATPSESAVRF